MRGRGVYRQLGISEAAVVELAPEAGHVDAANLISPLSPMASD
jgi:hypothetical protein